ncbi:hypothetical protein, partial [Pseudomonas plecoglossicida]|uniref:hypothetical protein n=1 Tax=Pseudomonas plecoglossicida TaxID=70775 RepID=UPI001C3E94F3
MSPDCIISAATPKVSIGAGAPKEISTFFCRAVTVSTATTNYLSDRHTELTAIQSITEICHEK